MRELRLDWVFENLANLDISYVVLRNYVRLPCIDPHTEDLDLLVDNVADVVRVLGLVPNPSSASSASFILPNVNDTVVLDLKESGDGYLPHSWCRDILARRQKVHNFYVPDQRNFMFSVWYHSVFHKKSIPAKYREPLKSFFGCNPEDLDLLILFLQENNYSITEPRDFVVRRNKPPQWKESWSGLWEPPARNAIGLRLAPLFRFKVQVRRLVRAASGKIKAVLRALRLKSGTGVPMAD